MTGKSWETLETPCAGCGYPEISHVLSPKKRRTWCSVWDPDRCLCESFVPPAVSS